MQGNYRHHYLSSAKPASSASSSAPISSTGSGIRDSSNNNNARTSKQYLIQQQQQPQVISTGANYNNGLPSIQAPVARHFTGPGENNSKSVHLKQAAYGGQQVDANNLAYRTSQDSRLKSSEATKLFYNNSQQPARVAKSSACNFNEQDQVRANSSSQVLERTQHYYASANQQLAGRTHQQPFELAADLQQRRQNQQQMQLQAKQQLAQHQIRNVANSAPNEQDFYIQPDHYASQLRSSQQKFQQFHQHQHQHHSNGNPSMQQSNQFRCFSNTNQPSEPASTSPSSSSSLSSSSPQSFGPQANASGCSASAGFANQTTANGSDERKRSQPANHKESSLRVNFNRTNNNNSNNPNSSNNDPDNDDDGESCRKKKYLTAKYGQQQMNLIKKRLKIEMWLYEQLQELFKGSKAEAELDDIDIDLDQLLDMEDDPTRQRWLKKTLKPYDDLPSDAVDKFIEDVLQQSKLL